MKTRSLLTTAVLCIGMLAAGSQASIAAKHKAKAKAGCPSPAVQAQSGGTGSPVAAGSERGSTDRAPAGGPGASGPAGKGTTASGRPC